jgi:ABC-type lipoprotein release transport system permease subunit
MRLLILLAWRNLWRYPRRTAIILLAVAVGMWSMLSMAAYMRGLMEQQAEDVIRNLVGHVQLHAPGFHDDPVITHRLPQPAGGLAETLNSPLVRAWAARVRVPAVIRSERETLGVSLLGIVPEQERGLSFIPEAISAGRYLDSAQDPAIVLGRALAERLETGLGKRVVIMSQTPDNRVAERGFRIVGLFDTPLRETENQFAFAGLETVQAMLEIPGEISELALLGWERKNLHGLQAALAQTAPELEIRDWLETNPLARVMVDTFEGFLLIWYAVVFLAMGFGLVNTLFMAIFERTREIAMMQALGMKARWIIGQILLESLFLLILGLLLGNLLGGLTLFYFFADGLDLSRWAQGYEMMGIRSVIYPLFEPADALIANLFILILGLLASLYPAWRAAGRIPARAMMTG